MARPQEFSTAQALHDALGVFWRQGYEATSLPDLLAATGLSKSSLYGTFGGKRELFLKAFDAYRSDRAQEMHRILGDGHARHAIETFFGKIIADARVPGFSRGCMSTNQAIEMAPHDVEVRARVEADFRLIEDALAATIGRGQAEGAIPWERDARAVARLLVVAFPGFQVIARAGVDGGRLQDALSLLLANLD